MGQLDPKAANQAVQAACSPEDEAGRLQDGPELLPDLCLVLRSRHWLSRAAVPDSSTAERQACRLTWRLCSSEQSSMVSKTVHTCTRVVLSPVLAICKHQRVSQAPVPFGLIRLRRTQRTILLLVLDLSLAHTTMDGCSIARSTQAQVQWGCPLLCSDCSLAQRGPTQTRKCWRVQACASTRELCVLGS